MGHINKKTCVWARLKPAGLSTESRAATFTKFTRNFHIDFYAPKGKEL